MVVFPHQARQHTPLNLYDTYHILLDITTPRRFFSASPRLLQVRSRGVSVQGVGYLSGNTLRWTQTATFPPHYGKFRVSCNHYSNCVARKGGLIACSACTGHEQLGQGWAVAAGSHYHHTCAVWADGRLICFGSNEDGQCDVPSDLGPVLTVAAGFGHTCSAGRWSAHLFWKE